MFKFLKFLKKIFDHLFTCFISLLSHLISFIDAAAANKAALLILKGGLTLFNAYIKFLGPYPHPTLSPARP